MKKKLPLMFLFLLVIPVFALIGCSEAKPSYSVFAYGSSFHGSTIGTGNYVEGSAVTLTATTNSSQDRILGWIYQNSLIISNDGTYSITNTVENEKVVKSTLTFTCSAATQGSYTALFDETDLSYTRFSGVMLSTEENATPAIELPQDAESLPNATLSVFQGNTSDLVFSEENMLFKQQTDEQTTSALKISVTGTKNALWLNNPQQIYSTINIDNSNFTLRATFSYKQSTEWSTPQNGVSYKVNYTNKEYQIVFRFTKSEQTYYLTLFYDNFTQNI